MRRAATSSGAVPWARASLAALLALALIGLSACGSGSRDVPASPIHGKTLTVYVSVPLLGSSSVSGTAVVYGARLALSQIHDQIGRYHIALKVLNDATAQRGGWDPGQTTLDARTAVLDPTTIGYVGELNSGASAVSIPPLNRAGIPQVSPASTAVGLTSSSVAAFPGEPQKYYPTGVRTFARVAGTDAVQALAQVRIQQSLGCRTVYVLDDGEVDGADAARSYELAAQAARLRVVGIQAFARGALTYQGLVTGVAHSAPDCVLISADTESGAVLLTRQLAAAVPQVKIFGTAGLAESTYADPGQGGIPLSLDPRVVLTSPMLGLGQYPAAARVFAADYQRHYGPLEPDSIFGYEAMSLLVSAITRATNHGRREAVRSKVRAALFGTRDRHSVLGTYSIDPDGDTTLQRFGVFGIVAGRLVFWESISA